MKTGGSSQDCKHIRDIGTLFWLDLLFVCSRFFFLLLVRFLQCTLISIYSACGNLACIKICPVITSLLANN